MMEMNLSQRRILAHLHGEACAAASRAINGHWGVGDQHRAALDCARDFESWARSGWADVAARDLGYDIANIAADRLGLGGFAGPHGGDSEEARLCRRMAARIRDVIREELRDFGPSDAYPDTSARGPRFASASWDCGPEPSFDYERHPSGFAEGAA